MSASTRACEPAMCVAGVCGLLDGGAPDAGFDAGPDPDAGSCPAGQVECPDGCTSLERDPDNCGRCANVCIAGQTCDMGACS